jgi:hypothetical protein
MYMNLYTCWGTVFLDRMMVGGLVGFLDSLTINWSAITFFRYLYICLYIHIYTYAQIHAYICVYTYICSFLHIHQKCIYIYLLSVRSPTLTAVRPVNRSMYTLRSASSISNLMMMMIIMMMMKILMIMIMTMMIMRWWW